MEKRQKPTLDGFVPRRPAGNVDSFSTQRSQAPHTPVQGLQRHNAEPTTLTTHGNSTTLKPVESAQSRRQVISRADVDESLQQIDSQEAQEGRRARRVKTHKPHPRRRKIIKWLIILLLLAGVAVAGWIGVKAFMASKSVFKGDIFGIIQQKDLKADANGRSNVLILGTSEDDPGHQAGHLTDSIMILSVSQKAKDAYMISIPRDLEVRYGMACAAGYSGKINGYFSCVNDDWTSTAAEDERQEKSREFFGGIVGLDIQYSVHVNYTVMRDVVKALDGITVTIESPDARGQMDGNFDWKCGATYAIRLQNCPPRGHFIDYPNGPVTLDAEHALYLAQARGDTEVNWGFPNSNFEREKNQQKIVVAIKDKALSTGTLTNLSKVSGLIDALGSNLRTNFDTSEIRTLMSLGADIKSTSIQSISLIDNNVVGGNAQPTAGMYEFSEIKALIQKTINATPVTKEAAHVVVLNASGVVGAARTEATKLEELGMVVDEIGNAPEGVTFTKNTFYRVKEGKSNTLTALKSRYGATSLSTETAPGDVAETTDFVIIILNPLISSNQ